tara:strand:- start:2138 stop:2308 length:171 start_codon:yes stop_codon:yes gene_type:complete
MSTSASRTVRIPDESRLIFISAFDTNRIVRIPKENRIVFVERQDTSAERIVYATED